MTADYSCDCLNILIYCEKAVDGSCFFPGYSKGYKLRMGGIVVAMPTLAYVHSDKDWKRLVCMNCSFSVAAGRMLDVADDNPLGFLPLDGIVYLNDDARTRDEVEALKAGPLYSDTFKLVIKPVPAENVAGETMKEITRIDINSKAEQALRTRHFEIEERVEEFRQKLMKDYELFKKKVELEKEYLMRSIVHAVSRPKVLANEQLQHFHKQQQLEQRQEIVEPFLEDSLPSSASSGDEIEPEEYEPKLPELGTSLPIQIPMMSRSIREQGRPIEKRLPNEAFEPPHILSAKTYQDTNPLAIFGELPPKNRFNIKDE